MKLTYELLDAGKSKNGAWSRQQLQVLGVKWPRKKGWMRRIVGQEYDAEVIDLFLKLKDKHLRDGLTEQFLFATEGL